MISYSRNGDGTGTLTITLTAKQEKVETVLEKVAESLYPPGAVVPFSALPAQDRLDLIEQKIKSFMVSRAKGQLQRDAMANINQPDPQW